MAVTDLSTFKGDEFVLHFGGRPNEVDAYTFANSLLAISEALRAINKDINPGANIEIVIDAVGTGSFRARLKKARTGLLAIAKDKAPDIAVGLLVAFIYDKIHNTAPKITINDDSYIVESGGDKIVLPKEVYDARRLLKHPEEIDRHVSRAFEVMEEDASVTEFGITAKIDDRVPLAVIPRSEFPRLSEPTIVEKTDPNHRIVEEDTTLVVLRAVLERSERKWQFVWNGVRISAPIKDETFFDKMARHEYEFGQGDTLEVKMAIHQTREDVSGAYINERYEVLQVKGHHQGPRQPPLL